MFWCGRSSLTGGCQRRFNRALQKSFFKHVHASQGPLDGFVGSTLKTLKLSYFITVQLIIATGSLAVCCCKFVSFHFGIIISLGVKQHWAILLPIVLLQSWAFFVDWQIENGAYSKCENPQTYKECNIFTIILLQIVLTDSHRFFLLATGSPLLEKFGKPYKITLELRGKIGHLPC